MLSPALYFAQLCILLFTLPHSTNATPLPSTNSSSSSDPILSLPYATYKGYHNTTSHIYQFRSIRFAASTTGENRWRAAQPPADERASGVQDASGWPKQCPQATSGGVISKDAYNPLQSLDDEDCLFLSVWAPDEVVLNGKDEEAHGKKGGGKGKKEKDLLPVLVWIHGGGWDRKSMALLNTPSNYPTNRYAFPPKSCQTTPSGNSTTLHSSPRPTTHSSVSQFNTDSAHSDSSPIRPWRLTVA